MSAGSSASVTPPVRRVASSSAGISVIHAVSSRGEDRRDLLRAQLALQQPLARRRGPASVSVSSSWNSSTSTPRVAHQVDERVELLARPAHPDHVVEQQLVAVGRRQALVREVGAVDDHAAQRPDLGGDAEAGGGGRGGHGCSPRGRIQLRTAAPPTKRSGLTASVRPRARRAAEDGSLTAAMNAGSGGGRGPTRMRARFRGWCRHALRLRAGCAHRNGTATAAMTRPGDMASPSTGETTPGDGERRPAQTRQPKPPSLLDAILPIVVLIVLIALTIASFGVGATDGPLQVALMLSAAFASLVALKNGYTSAALADAAIGGVTHRGGRDLHPAVGRRADRHLEHGRHDPDRRRLRRPGCSTRACSSSRRRRSARSSAWSPAARGPRPARSASRSSGWRT